MRTEDDAVRSLQRFFAGILAAPWEIVLVVEGGSPPERPYATVEFLDAITTSGAPAIQEVVVPAVVNLYPAIYESRRLAQEGARELRELVWRAVKWGPTAQALGGRMTTDRIPLWDYDPATVPAGQVAPYRNYCDYMRVDSFGMRTHNEDATPREVQVVVDLRLTFVRGLPVPSGQRPFQRLVATGGPEG